jgi:glycyl-tRNA synthetase
LWWKYFIQDREDMVGIDGGIMLHSKVWEASGHLENFKDSLVECKKCHKRFRPDKLEDASKCPECGGELTEPKKFLGMFKTVIGPVEKEGTVVYLRPETAQAIFVDYKSVLDSTNMKIPFGVGQIGKAFRNEVTTGNFIFRTYEFEQMEIEYFISPDENWNKIFEDWMNYIHDFLGILGIAGKNLIDHEIPKSELAHYSKRTVDMEYKFPFGQDELWAIAYRTDYDLAQHQKYSGKSMEYYDEEGKKKYIPHVIEPTFGVDRTVLATICEAYTEEKLSKGETRTVLRFSPRVAPYKVAVFPLLSNKKRLTDKAREIYSSLKGIFETFWDDRGNIGKRYRYQDEAGTPFCVTVDFDTLKDDTVTVRDRDSMKQERVKVEDLGNYLNDKMESK